ncbi:D-isomer specific 2-hydroxyacid dehydrogenase family protein [Naasia lichenicola]|uniref:Hydroxyacid dehydrogenase n=1 Tax=Naasia lichenicola TaxID=2565933 RepID=A0A4S4FF00_9MICO|nr:D-isomer specific 2-hydroxyacid dehydrogenase family protein [Naasia lichenicola]THG28144.1 hydroxyacid dehydrogenase [Naasia lichenicola]
MTRSDRFAHQAVTGEAKTLPDEQRPAVGPIALLPAAKAESRFVDAVSDAGGEIGELGSDTRAVVWLANDHPEALVEVLEQHPQIQWVQLPWAGVDAFADALSSHDRADLLWTSAKGAYAQPVAEHALALALAGLRSLSLRARATSWGEKIGESLYGASVTIVGAGGIAIELIRLLQPFSAEVTIVRRSAGEVSGAFRTVTSDRLDDVLPETDVLILAAASTGETRHLIDARRLSLLKPSAVLVNIARGPLVDTDALLDALQDERLLAAGLDVTDPEPLPEGHPLWTEPRALITPHSADTPEMIAPLLAERVRANVEAFVSTGRFIGIVDPKSGY